MTKDKFVTLRKVLGWLLLSFIIGVVVGSCVAETTEECQDSWETDAYKQGYESGVEYGSLRECVKKTFQDMCEDLGYNVNVIE